MRKATLVIISMLLAAPAAAHAKAGVEFDTYPEETEVGTPVGFSVMAFRDPPPSGGEGHPLVGAHPLVTFRSNSGRVIRVRASRTDRYGVGRGEVTFTDKGPWQTEMDIPGVHIGSEFSQPIEVGTGLTQTIPSADSTRPKSSAPASETEFPWVWVLTLGTIGSALLVLAMRRRGHWGAA
jgi:hypothetical protein